jgi:hypothetical protein
MTLIKYCVRGSMMMCHHDDAVVSHASLFESHFTTECPLPPSLPPILYCTGRLEESVS